MALGAPDPTTRGRRAPTSERVFGESEKGTRVILRSGEADQRTLSALASTRAGAGLWAKGKPPWLVGRSLHSWASPAVVQANT